MVYLIRHSTYSFYELWFIVMLIFTFFTFIFLYIFKRRNDQIVSDTYEIIEHLQEISNKNYGDIIQTKYFSEFLQIEVLLKNIVKKLYNKDTKK